MRQSRALFWTAAALVFLVGAARFLGSGFLPAARALAGDFAASFPTEYFARLRPDFPADNVWPGWNYGPMFHFLTLPLLALPRYWMVPLVWALTNLAALVVSFVIVCRLAGVQTLASPRVVALAGLSLFFQPLANCFAQGNIEILELLMILAAIAMLPRARAYPSGVLLGVAAMTKVLPIGFLGWLAIRRRWGGVIAGAVVIVLVTGIAAVTLDWSKNISLQRSDLVTDAPVVGVHELSITSLFAHRTSMLDYAKSTVRWFPSTRSRLAVRAGTLASVLVAAAFGLVLLARRRARISPFEIGILFLAMFMIPPWNHDYYYIFALVPFAFVFLNAIETGKRGVLAVAAAAYVLMSPPVPFGLIDRAHLFPVPFAYIENYYDLPVIGALLLWGLVTHQMFVDDDRQPGSVPVMRPRHLAAGVVAATALAIVIAAPWRVRAEEGSPASNAPLTFTPPVSLADRPALAVSPAGDRIAYVSVGTGTTVLCLQGVSESSARCVEGSDGAAEPFFAPDGQSVAFFAHHALRVVPASGGAVRTVADTPGADSGSWGIGGDIVFTTPEGIFRVAPSGGKPMQVVRAASDGSRYRWPVAAPGGKAIIVTMLSPGSTGGSGRIVVWSPNATDVRFLVEGTQPNVDERSGTLVFALRGHVMAGRFDVSRLAVSTVPSTIASGVAVASSGGSQFAANGGTLLYLPSDSVPARTLSWVTRSGSSTPVGIPGRAFAWPRLSPDGTRAAVTVEDATSDVWVYGLSDRVPHRMTFKSTRNDTPAWRPGQREDVLAFARPVSDSTRPVDDKWSLMLTSQKVPDASALWTSRGTLRVGGFSHDGRWLAGSQSGDLWVLRVPDEGSSPDVRSARLQADRSQSAVGGGDRTAPVPDVTLIRTTSNDRQPALSSDGRWIAYTSNQSGRDEIWVRPLTAAGDPVQVSLDGGREPAWSATGRELFFRRGQTMMSVTIDAGAAFRAGVPRELFQGEFMTSDDAADYDVTPDGERFLMVSPPAAVPQSGRLVRQWPGLVQR